MLAMCGRRTEIMGRDAMLPREMDMHQTTIYLAYNNEEENKQSNNNSQNQQVRMAGMELE